MMPWEKYGNLPSVNNPGNLRHPGDPTGFQQYDSPEAGEQAIDRQLQLYAKRGLVTPRQIISTWAPANENPTGALVDNASRRLGVNPDDRLDMNDPAVLARVRGVIKIQEGNGPKMPWEKYGKASAAPAEPDEGFAEDAVRGATYGSRSQFKPGRDLGFLGGVVRGVRDPIDAGAQLLTRGLEAIAPSGSAFERFMQAERQRVEGINANAERDYVENWRGGVKPQFDAGRLVGNIAATAPMGPSRIPATLMGKVGQGAATGAAFGALQPVGEGQDFWLTKGEQTSGGAMFGGAGAAVGAGLSRVVSPKVSDDVRLLMREGVDITPGQAMGGAWRRAEEAAGSVPILGSAIRMGELRATETMNTAALNRALMNLGQRLPKNLKGEQAIDFTEDALRKGYDRVLERMKTPKVDDQLLDDLIGLQTMVRNQPKEMGERLDRIISNEILGRTDQGRLTSEAIKKAESELGALARGLRRDPSMDNRTLGGAVSEVQNSLRNWLERAAPEGVAQELKRVNSGWAAFLRSQRAASSVAADHGTFTPAQLHDAVKAFDPSRNKGAFARGDALMQDLSGAAKSVMTSRTPNSGTADRLMAAGLMGSALTGGAVLTPGLAAGALPGVMYLPGVQRTIAKAMTTRPQGAESVADLMRRLSAPAGVASGYSLMDQ